VVALRFDDRSHCEGRGEPPRELGSKGALLAGCPSGVGARGATLTENWRVLRIRSSCILLLPSLKMRARRGRETRTEPRRRGAEPMSDVPTPSPELEHRGSGPYTFAYLAASGVPPRVLGRPVDASRKSSTAMSGSWVTCEKKAATLRPVAPSTISVKRGRIQS
jgi:hypothetical protein